MNREVSDILVSIGVCVYNEEAYLRETLDSLLAQTHSHFEVLIRDNASTDGTEAICREYAAKDARIRYARNSVNVGAHGSFNLIASEISGKYFLFAGAHDKFRPDFIQKALPVMEKDPAISICYCQTQFVSKEGQALEVFPALMDIRARAGGIFDPVLQFNLMIWGCVSVFVIHGLMRTQFLKRTRLARPTIGSDMVLLAEMALLGPFAQLPEVLFFSRRFREFDEKDMLQRQLAYMFPDARKKAHFPYAVFAGEYFRILGNAELRLSFFQKLSLFFSLMQRFACAVMGRPLRAFTSFKTK